MMGAEFYVAYSVAVGGGIAAGFARHVWLWLVGWVLYAFGLMASARFYIGPAEFDAYTVGSQAACAATLVACAFVACIVLSLVNSELRSRWSPSAAGSRRTKSPLRFAWGRSRFSTTAQTSGFSRAPRRARHGAHRP